MQAVYATGKKLASLLGGTPAASFKKSFGKMIFLYDSKQGGSCERGEGVVVCGDINIDNRLITHELGHSLANKLSRKPYEELGKAAIEETEDGELKWITGTHPGGVFERTLRGYKGEYAPDVYHGKEWNDWNSNTDNIARNEDFADMFMNWVHGTFSSSPAGIARDDWMNNLMTTNLAEWTK